MHGAPSVQAVSAVGAGEGDQPLDGMVEHDGVGVEQHEELVLQG